jgi:hypothetical protein
MSCLLELVPESLKTLKKGCAVKILSPFFSLRPALATLSARNASSNSQKEGNLLLYKNSPEAGVFKKLSLAGLAD